MTKPNHSESAPQSQAPRTNDAILKMGRRRFVAASALAAGSGFLPRETVGSADFKKFRIWDAQCPLGAPVAGFVEMAVRELGADRVIWASDAGGRSFASQLAKVYEARIPDAAKQKILCDNFRKQAERAMHFKKN